MSPFTCMGLPDMNLSNMFNPKGNPDVCSFFRRFRMRVDGIFAINVAATSDSKLPLTDTHTTAINRCIAVGVIRSNIGRYKESITAMSHNRSQSIVVLSSLSAGNGV